MPPEPNCERCRKPKPLCVCDRIPALAVRTEVLILQHPQESHELLATAHLTELSLDRARVQVGLSWASLEHALGHRAELKNWGVLYMGSFKKPLTEAQKAKPLLLLDRHGEERTLSPGLSGIVVLDGSWSQAKTLWWRNPWMLKLNRVLLHPSEPSVYGRLRKEPRRECLSTLEAVAETLVGLGEDPAIRTDLKRLLRTLVQRVRSQQDVNKPSASSKHGSRKPKAPQKGRRKQGSSRGGGPLD